MHTAKIKNIEDKIPDIAKLATNASLNAKIKAKGVNAKHLLLLT